MARIAAVAPDLFFASKIDATLRGAGHDVELVQAPAASGAAADLLIVDLDAAGADVTPPPGVPRLGFYSHVDVDTKRRAEEAGYDLVVPRSRMAREMPALVEGLLR
jgi:hypothetical protein